MKQLHVLSYETTVINSINDSIPEIGRLIFIWVEPPFVEKRCSFFNMANTSYEENNHENWFIGRYNGEYVEVFGHDDATIDDFSYWAYIVCSVEPKFSQWCLNFIT